MKIAMIAAPAAVAGLITACTSEHTTVVEPMAAPAPAAAPMVEPAAGPSKEVIVTYTPPDGMPAAKRMADAYCTQTFGKGTAQLMSDSPPGRATFACPGM